MPPGTSISKSTSVPRGRRRISPHEPFDERVHLDAPAVSLQAHDAGARQLPLDEARHRLDLGFDDVGTRMLAVFAHGPCFRRDDGERRLEPVGEIAGPRSRAFDRLGLRIDERVQFLDERNDFIGECAGKPFRSPATHRKDISHATSGRKPTATWIQLAAARKMTSAPRKLAVSMA